MIKFFGRNDETGRILLGLILVKGNMKLLVQKNPIHFSAEEMGLSEIKVTDIMIAYYPTEEACKEAFEKQGIIDQHTKIRHEVDSMKRRDM